MDECIKTRCDPLIVFSENGRKVTFHNGSRLQVREVAVDGCAIKTGIRCDYLLSEEENWYVELKGSDVDHALNQICETVRKLNSKFENKSANAVIVCSHVPAITGFQKAWAKATKDGSLCLSKLKLKTQRLDILL